MKKNKFVFVILNYITENDTIECVNSIFNNCKQNDFEIVIVDNASPNTSGINLRNKYKDEKLIHVILSKKNLGFANGNNLGFKYAKQNLNSDYIILCNSDTKILQKDFCRKVIDKFEETNFAVLGPRELLPNGSYYHLNITYPTKKLITKRINEVKIDLLCTKYSILEILRILRKIKNKIKNILSKFSRQDSDVNKEHVNIVLHGAFLIFSKTYINDFDGLDERTFFYEEENLLAIRLKKNNMLSIYYPEITILHNKASATNARTKNNKEKKKFIAENELASLNIVLKELNGN